MSAWKQSLVLLAQGALLSGCSVPAVAGPYWASQEVKEVQVRDENHKIISVITNRADIDALGTLFQRARPVEQPASSHAWTHDLDITAHGRWVYDASSGTTAKLSHKRVPLYRLMDDDQFRFAAMLPPGTLLPSADTSERLLMTADEFTSSRIAQAGVTPPVVHAFRALFRAQDARDRFLRVTQRATVEGQIFGLCGLYFLDPPAFERESIRLREAGSRVRTMFGCELDVETTTALLTPNPAARKLPHEWDPTLWSKPDDAIRLDIPSGGRCYELRSE